MVSHLLDPPLRAGSGARSAWVRAATSRVAPGADGPGVAGGSPEVMQCWVRWLAAPAMGLDGARPIDLLRTLQGSELVAEFLGRLEHGVYN